MSTTAHDKNDRRRLAITFKDFADVDADPDAVAFKIVEPDGVEVDYIYQTDAELVKDATGKYYVDYLFTKAGRHKFTFTGTGTIDSAESADIYIRA